MFCPNCGNKLNNNECFCPNCGLNTKAVDSSSVTTTELLSSKSVNFFKPIFNKIKNFVIKYKKQFLISLSACLIVIIGIVLFNKFYDFTKINWVENYGDYSLEYTSSNKIELKAEAFDKEKNPIQELNYITDNGSVEIKDSIAYWSLPEEEGTYFIYAVSPSGKKIKKEITVIKIDDNGDDSPLNGMISADIDENTDSDNDQITDYKEQELKTNPYSADTDSDGLTDYYEINVSKTDPLKEDTDSDGLNDGDELDLELDPLKEDSKGDGIKDSQRSVNYTINNNDLGINIEINGKGNIPSSTIDVFTNSTFTDMDGLLDKVYNFYSDGTIEKAIVKIKYTLEEIQKKGLTEDNLTLYYFNEETKKLEAMPTTIDKENKLIVVSLTHFSKYVIGDKSTVLTDTNSQIMLVIDNSVSMYTYSQLTALGYTSITGADGNDSEFKRLTVTNKLVDMLTGNYHFGVAQFAGNYVNLNEFTDNKDTVKNSINSIKNDMDSVTNGTNIVNSLKKGIDEFSTDDNSHYLVLLTDGKDTSNTLIFSKSSLIAKAKTNNVKVCVIGLGSEIDTDDLNEIAESTGCDYYNATDSSALDEIYSIVGSDINYNLVDTDQDGKTDGTVIADSGFIVTRDGFSFENFRSVQSTGGNCYGMATFAMLNYRNQLPSMLGPKEVEKWYLNTGKIKWNSSGYNLGNTYFSSQNSLYNYQIKDEAIKTRFNLPADIRDRIEDKVYYVSDKYYSLLSNIGIDFSIKKYDGKIKGIDKKQAVGHLDVENEKFEKNALNEDVQLFKAIWRLYILQLDDKTQSFSNDADKTYNSLVKELNSGNPIVLGIGGDHAVNAVRLIQDNTDSNKLKLEIYDNKFPGEKKYIEIKRKKYSNIIQKWWNGDYNSEYSYSFSYDDYGDKNISVELNYATIN